MTLGELGAPATMGEVLSVMLASPPGVVSLVGVLAAGAIFAIAMFAISVVTLPAMLDRPRGSSTPWPSASRHSETILVH